MNLWTLNNKCSVSLQFSIRFQDKLVQIHQCKENILAVRFVYWYNNIKYLEETYLRTRLTFNILRTYLVFVLNKQQRKFVQTGHLLHILLQAHIQLPYNLKKPKNSHLPFLNWTITVCLRNSTWLDPTIVLVNTPYCPKLWDDPYFSQENVYLINPPPPSITCIFVKT